jgi:hypothetical protein
MEEDNLGAKRPPQLFGSLKRGAGAIGKIGGQQNGVQIHFSSL